jgi:hypothetical protein
MVWMLRGEEINVQTPQNYIVDIPFASLYITKALRTSASFANL